MPKHGSIILYVHGNQKARLDGQPRTSTSTLTQLLNYGALGKKKKKKKKKKKAGRKEKSVSVCGGEKKKGLLLHNLISFYSGFLYMGYIA